MHWHAQSIRRTFHYQYCQSSSSWKWHLEESVIMARDVLEAGCERRRYQGSFWYLDSSVWPRKAIEIVCWMCTQYLVMRWNVNFVSILFACNSGTIRWEFFVPVSYCRATQDLENGDWIMGIHPGKPKRPSFCTRHYFVRLQIACTKRFTVELMDVSGLWDLNKKKVEELLYPQVFVWSPRSKVWPR